MVQSDLLLPVSYVSHGGASPRSITDFRGGDIGEKVTSFYFGGNGLVPVDFELMKHRLCIKVSKVCTDEFFTFVSLDFGMKDLKHIFLFFQEE